MPCLSVTPKNFWFLFGGIWFGVGLLFLIIGLSVGGRQMSLSKRFDFEGRRVEGVVLTKSVHSSSSGSGSKRKKSTTYEITFRFLTPGGLINGNAQVNPETWDRLIERGPIEVIYLPDDPQHYRVEGQSSWWVLPVIFTLLGGPFAIIGGFLLLKAMNQSRFRERMQREGLTTDGTVVDVRPGIIRINRMQQWNLHYRYQDEHGNLHDGKWPLSPEDSETWKAGEKGKVRYDPRQPRKSVWVGNP